MTFENTKLLFASRTIFYPRSYRPIQLDSTSLFQSNLIGRYEQGLTLFVPIYLRHTIQITQRNFPCAYFDNLFCY